MINPPLYERIAQRLAQRSDSEFEQAIVRIVLLVVTASYFATDYFAEFIGDSHRTAMARLAITLSAFITIGLFAAIVSRPEVSHVRRSVGMVHDVLIISVALYYGEQATTVFSTVYLWITLGNGIRFGNRYLYTCATLSVAGFVVVYVNSDFWQSQDALAANVLIALVVLPLYAGNLLRSFHSTKDQLQLQATVDPVTGLLNRSEFESTVGRLLTADHNEHVLIFCDLDRFKEVNDAAGHAAGDKILADVGDIIQGCVRNDDLSARMGGDEFCILLKRCELEKGQQVAENIRSEVSRYRLAWGTGYYSVGISIGVAPTKSVKDTASLFRLADAACYAAKNSGRNNVHVVDPRAGLMDTQKISGFFDEVANVRQKRASHRVVR